jgi:hypothetical protein
VGLLTALYSLNMMLISQINTKPFMGYLGSPNTKHPAPPDGARKAR